MLTSAECQAKADEKFAQAEREPGNHKRFLTAAESWVILAGMMKRLELSMTLPDEEKQE